MMFRLLKSIFELIFLAVEMVFIVLFVLAKFVYYRLEKLYSKNPTAAKKILFLAVSALFFVWWGVWTVSTANPQLGLPDWVLTLIVAIIVAVLMGMVCFFVFLPEIAEKRKSAQ